MIYDEIFGEKVYFKHGITLTGREAPLVIDVGGHVGMFAVFVAESVPNSQIQIFEPVPLLAEAIQWNLDRFGCAVAGAGDQEARVVLHKLAVGDEEMEISFKYDPRVSAATSLFPKHFAPSKVDVIDLVRALHLDGIRAGAFPELSRFLGRLLNIPVLRYVTFLALLPFLLLYVLWLWASQPMSLQAKVRPLSQILREQRLHGKCIDLLKVDVEGAEWMVLMGIDDATWTCIDQVRPRKFTG